MIAAILHGDERAGVARGLRSISLGGDVPGAGIEFGLVGKQPIDLGKRGQGSAFDLCGATRHDQTRIGVIAAGLADRLPGLPHRFIGDRTGIDHDETLLVGQHGPQVFALRQVQPATQRYHFRHVRRRRRQGQKCRGSSRWRDRSW